MKKHKIVVGITGASGSIFGKLLIEKLLTLQEQIETVGIIFSENARKVWRYELGEDSPPLEGGPGG